MPYWKLEKVEGGWISKRQSSSPNLLFHNMTLCRRTSAEHVHVITFASREVAIAHLESYTNGIIQKIQNGYPTDTHFLWNENDEQIVYISDIVLKKGFTNWVAEQRQKQEAMETHYKEQGARLQCKNATEASSGRYANVGVCSKLVAENENFKLWRCPCGNAGVEKIYSTKEVECFCKKCLRVYKRLAKQEAEVLQVKRITNKLDKLMRSIKNEHKEIRPTSQISA